MFIKLTYLLILLRSALAEDGLVAGLAGEHGRNRVTVCLENGTQCEGALWETQWVIARASCLPDKSMYQMAVIRNVQREECPEYVKETSARVRKVQLMFKHPAHAHSSRVEFDLALLRLEYPYPDAVERLADSAVVETFLQQFEPWLENTIKGNQQHKPYVRLYPRRFGVSAFELPVKMFISLVVVPSALFIVFFFFITCYTKPKSRAPNRQYEKV